MATVTPLSIEGRTAYRAPEPILEKHRLDEFRCGKDPLDAWLRSHAIKNEGRASRTFVVADAAFTVVGYYTLATGSVTLGEVPRKYRHGLPNPVPVMLLGRLAVHEDHIGKGLGSSLLQEALLRTIRVSQDVGVRALIVHALDDPAVTFYAKYGFQAFPAGTRTMFLPMETIQNVMSHS